ncbi:hypothetical protein BJ944DRAFT_262836 [Cunninghamella echinulata]|nr:hypothetical protein BJ944DRAFT_262836 [Cunninghamella echinulata]
MFKRQDVPMKNTGTDTVQSQDINNSSSSTSSSSSDSLRRSQMVLATDITQGLISEVRKLQSCLLEKDQIIKELEISQADINKENILIQKHLKQKDEIEEKLKEENWNLEVTNQELQEKLTDLNQTIGKLNVEHTKVLKQLRNSAEQIEIFKAQDEKTKSTMEAMKARYDHEQQVLRRNNGNLHREMEQLKKTMNDLNTEFKIQKAKLAIKSTVDNNVNQQHQSSNNNALLELSKDDTTFDSIKDVNDQQGVNDSTNSSSSSKLQHWALEVDTLKQSLSHAHRTISILRSNLHKEKLEKMEFKKMLADTQEQVEQLQKDIEQRNGNNRSSKKKTSSKSNTTTATAATTSSRKRVGIRKKSSKISLLKSPNSENNSQRLDENCIEEEENHIEIRDEPAASDSNNSSDEDDASSQDGSMDDDYLGGGNPLSLELSGQSLGMELQMGGFMGSSFKSLSSELNDSMQKPQTFDKGINTENVWTMIDNKPQIINPKIFDQDQKQQQQQLRAEILPEIQYNIGSLANPSTPTSSIIITQNVGTMDADQSIKNSNNIHAETSTTSNHDISSHVSPITKISVDQQRGKISNMGQYHTSVHSQEPFTIQQHNDDDSSVINKKIVQDDTIGSLTTAFNETNILVANTIEQQDQMTRSEITSGENAPTISDSEIKIIKPKEQLLSSSLSTPGETALPLPSVSTDIIKTNSIVYKELTEEHHNHIHENGSRHIVEDEQMDNRDIAIVKSLADEIVNAKTTTKDTLSHLTNESSQVECSNIGVHGEKKTVDQQMYQVKENEQNITETIHDTQKMVEHFDEENNELHHQLVQDNENYQKLNQQLETNKFENVTTQQENDSKQKITLIQQVEMNRKDNQEITKQVTTQNENNQRRAVEQEVIQQADTNQNENQEVIKQVVIQKEIIEQEAIQQTEMKQKADQEDIIQHDYTQQENNQQINALNTIQQVTIQQGGVKQEDSQKLIKQYNIQNENSEPIVAEQENAEQKVAKLVEEPRAIQTTNQHDKPIEIEQTSIQQIEEYEHHNESSDKNSRNDIYIDRTTMVEGYDLDSMTVTHDMISRDEANALIKMAIADALAKERLEAANKRRQSEADFISKSEAEMLTKLRVDEALKKERERLSKVVQKRHSIISLKQLKDKESDNKNNTNNSLKESPETKDQTQSPSHSPSQLQSSGAKTSISSQDNQAIVQTSKLAQRALQHRASTKNLSPIPQPSTSTSSTNTQTSTSPPSRLGLFSGFSKLQPSLSTPSKGSRNIRPSVSSSSLRRASRPRTTTTASSSTNTTEMDTDSRKSYMASTSPLKKTNSVDAAQHLSPLSAAESFGNVRITEKSTYTYKRPMTSSNQDTLSKQPSIQSFVSIASSMHDRSGNSFPYSTDEKLQLSNDLVSAITQTMIGEWMWKYTRRHVGNGISENKHKRFFWLHPFARTLYWNTVEPGAESKEVKAKSAFIESVSSIPNHENSNECPFSLLIKTSKRDLKITASNLERHEIWKLALSFLIIPENYEDTVGNVVNNSVSLSTSKMPPSTVTLLTSASNTTHEEADEIINNEKSITNSEEAYDSDDSLNVHITDHSDTPKPST